MPIRPYTATCKKKTVQSSFNYAKYEESCVQLGASFMSEVCLVSIKVL